MLLKVAVDDVDLDPAALQELHHVAYSRSVKIDTRAIVIPVAEPSTAALRVVCLFVPKTRSTKSHPR
jgi:hypothetical protein